MVFFLDAEDHVYARYGGRDAKNAEHRQSLPGLRYTMESVLAVHAREKKDAKRDFAPKSQDKPKFVRDMAGVRGGRGCLHCHQVKEVLERDLRRTGKWDRAMIYRYPLPENVGFALEVDRGNVVQKVAEKTPTAAIGLKPGDVVRRLNGVPIHSFGDAQFALDRAPKAGTIEIAWQRGDQTIDEKLTLSEGWRKSEVSWRPSMRGLIPFPRVGGKDLTDEEKRALGLSVNLLAFRQRDFVSTILKEVGLRSGDIILGFDGKRPEMNVEKFLLWAQKNYLIGDPVTINVLRDGKPMDFHMKLQR